MGIRRQVGRRTCEQGGFKNGIRERLLSGRLPGKGALMAWGGCPVMTAGGAFRWVRTVQYATVRPIVLPGCLKQLIAQFQAAFRGGVDNIEI